MSDSKVAVPVVTAAVDVDAINDMDTVPWFPMSVILIEQLRNYPEIRYRLLDSQGKWFTLASFPPVYSVVSLHSLWSTGLQRPQSLEC